MIDLPIQVRCSHEWIIEIGELNNGRILEGKHGI